MRIPFWKAHGAGNDFVFTFTAQADLPPARLAEIAVAICDRTTGVGADGWYLVDTPGPNGAHARVRLFNSNGSPAELSGNGTRCAAAILVESGLAADPIRISTGAGIVALHSRGHQDTEYQFETLLPPPAFPAGDSPVLIATPPISHSGWVINVGNPQFAVAVDTLDFDWKAVGAALEGNSYFPARTNVSFFRKLSDESIEARFFERGAGPTRSSGTGSVGAAIAAVRSGLVTSPVRVSTEGGSLVVGWNAGGAVSLTGPAVPIAEGTFITAIK